MSLDRERTNLERLAQAERKMLDPPDTPDCRCGDCGDCRMREFSEGLRLEELIEKGG